MLLMSKSEAGFRSDNPDFLSLNLKIPLESGLPQGPGGLSQDLTIPAGFYLRRMTMNAKRIFSIYYVKRNPL
jgi:hypothetical protein